MARELSTSGFTCAPSQANFLLATMTSQPPGTARLLLRGLADNGIFVRWFDQDRLRNSLRISIGTTDENDALLRGLDRLLRAQSPGAEIDP